MSLKKNLQFLECLAARVLIALLRIIPIRAAYAVARFTAKIVFLLTVKRSANAQFNIDRAFGTSLSRAEKTRLIRDSYQNVLLSVLDLFLSIKIRPEAEKKFTIHGLENYDKALAAGKGVVLVLSHLGSWEYMAFLFYLTNTHCSAVVKAVHNPYLNEALNEARRVTGLAPLQKKGAAREVLRVLKANQTVAILIDQWAGAEGIWVPFFGENTSTTTLPARLFEQTGCALLLGCCLRREDGHFDIEIQPPLLAADLAGKSAREITVQLNENLEKAILRNPGQWAWGHRRWKAKPGHIREH